MESKLVKVINGSLYLLFMLGMSTMVMASAQDGSGGSGGVVQPPVTVGQPSGFIINDIGLLVTNVVAIFLVIAALAVFVYLVWGGLQWVTSGGDKAATQAARDRIGAALIGLAIVAVGWALYQIVIYFFQIDTSKLPTATTNPITK